MAKNRNSGLGRGLDALLSSTYEESTSPSKEETRRQDERPQHHREQSSAQPLPQRTIVTLNAEEEAEIAVAAAMDHYSFEEKKEAKEESPNRRDAVHATQRKSVPESMKISHQQPAATPVEKRDTSNTHPAAPMPPSSIDVNKDNTQGQTEEPQIRQEEVVSADKEKIEPSDEIPIDLIEPNPDQPRITFKKDELEELSASISRDGLLQPILVRSLQEGKYQIIAGERRWQACKMAGLTKVPVRIKEADDAEAHILALVENIQRSDLNPIEEAYGYRRMIEQGMTQAEVAQQLSKGRSTIANALRLLDLPEEAQELLFEEKITAGHARAILSVPTPEGKKKLTDKIQKENLSVRQAESIARLYAVSAKKGEKPTRSATPKAYKIFARDLKARLQSPVKVKSSGGKNKIEIEFKDEEDLQRIYELLSTREEKQE